MAITWAISILQKTVINVWLKLFGHLHGSLYIFLNAGMEKNMWTQVKKNAYSSICSFIKIQIIKVIGFPNTKQSWLIAKLSK